MGDEVVDSLLSLDDQTERGNLARAVAHSLVLEADVLGLDELGLETRKGDSEFQVQNLSDFDCKRRLRIGSRGQLPVVHLLQIRFDQRRETRPIKLPRNYYKR